LLLLPALTFAHLAFCASDIFRLAAALSRVPRRDDVGATAICCRHSARLTQLAQYPHAAVGWLSFVFSARSSTTIASTPVIFAMAGLQRKYFRLVIRTGGGHSCWQFLSADTFGVTLYVSEMQAAFLTRLGADWERSCGWAFGAQGSSAQIRGFYVM
jgi:hypothetical protein